MLSNPGLLAAINNTLPFLTSAPDLTSRMKRRMRMARGEPVWVKPLREVFPWTLEYYRDYKREFSDGWLVYLYSHNERPSVDTLPIKLIVGGLHRLGKIELNLLEVMKEVNPQVYREWVGEGFPPQGDDCIDYIERFHFHVQEGMVVVGLSGINLALRKIRCT